MWRCIDVKSLICPAVLLSKRPKRVFVFRGDLAITVEPIGLQHLSRNAFFRKCANLKKKSLFYSFFAFLINCNSVRCTVPFFIFCFSFFCFQFFSQILPSTSLFHLSHIASSPLHIHKSVNTRKQPAAVLFPFSILWHHFHYPFTPRTQQWKVFLPAAGRIQCLFFLSIFF